MTRSDLIAVSEIDPPPPEQETRVLRAVVYLTYAPSPNPYDDGIEEVQSTHDAEKDIWRALTGLAWHPEAIEVVDAEYMSVEQSEL